MTPFAPAATPPRLPLREATIGFAAALLLTLLAGALVRHGAPAMSARGMSPWLMLHLVTVVPAAPLGAYVLLARKGDALHRLLGRTWAVLMILTSLASFGVHTITGGLSPIHALSVLVLVSVPLNVWRAMRGEIERHRKGMTRVYIGLVVAGLAAFVPGRMLGDWLFG